MDRMDQLPLPNLQLYSVISGFGVFYAVVYALTASESFTNLRENDVWCTAVCSTRIYIYIYIYISVVLVY